MAKKKKVEPEADDTDDSLDDEDFGDFGDDDFDDDDDIEIAVPKVSKTEEGGDDVDAEGEEDEDDFEEDYMLEDEEEVLTYQHVDVSINQLLKKNDYEVVIEGQSHGFCNIYVKQLLEIEGVDVAAYKISSLDHPHVFIRLFDGYKIKDILHKAINMLREEVEAVQKLFLKLI